MVVTRQLDAEASGLFAGKWRDRAVRVACPFVPLGPVPVACPS